MVGGGISFVVNFVVNFVDEVDDKVDDEGSRSRCVSSTRRLKVWRRLLVVTKPKRRSWPAQTRSAAWFHQYMTKSLDSPTSL